MEDAIFPAALFFFQPPVSGRLEKNITAGKKYGRLEKYKMAGEKYGLNPKVPGAGQNPKVVEGV